MTATREVPTEQIAIIKALEPYSTCDVSDALLKLKTPHGGYLAGPTLWSPERQSGETKIIGPAYTVQYVPLSDTASPRAASHYIDSVPSGSIVVISSPTRVVNAMYGGLMSTRAQARGAKGTVVDGRVRDLQEHRRLNYPVFAKDIGTASPYEVARVSEINGPIHMRNEGQDVLVRPNDYIIGDLNGVVCLPAELAQEAIELMADIQAADARVAADILQGRGFVEASQMHRKKSAK